MTKRETLPSVGSDLRAYETAEQGPGRCADKSAKPSRRRATAPETVFQPRADDRSERRARHETSRRPSPEVALLPVGDPQLGDGSLGNGERYGGPLNAKMECVAMGGFKVSIVDSRRPAVTTLDDLVLRDSAAVGHAKTLALDESRGRLCAEAGDEGHGEAERSKEAQHWSSGVPFAPT